MLQSLRETYFVEWQKKIYIRRTLRTEITVV